MRDTIIIHGYGRLVTRSAKLAEFLLEEGFRVSFWGWDRNGEMPTRREENGVPHEMLMTGGGEANYGLVGRYPLWSARVFRRLRNERPAAVLAVNLESALPCALVKKRHNLRFIYDNADTFYMRYRMSRSRLLMLQALERWALRQADLVLLPDENRITTLEEPFASKIVVIYNCPQDVPVPYGLSNDRPLTVCLSGYLTEDRGTRLLLQAARHVDGMKVLAAGIIPDAALEHELRQHPQVEFRGLIPLRESLAMCHETDVVFSFYEPKTEIYRRAAPNKWYDAMMAGKPVLVNSEVLGADRIKREDIGYALPYGDLSALVACLKGIQENPDEARKKGHRARRLFEAEYNWTNMKSRLRGAMIRAGWLKTSTERWVQTTP